MYRNSVRISEAGLWSAVVSFGAVVDRESMAVRVVNLGVSLVVAGY